MENKTLCGNTITNYTTTLEVEVTNYLHKHPRASLNEVLTHFQHYKALDIERYYYKWEDAKKEKRMNIFKVIATIIIAMLMCVTTMTLTILFANWISLLLWF